MNSVVETYQHASQYHQNQVNLHWISVIPSSSFLPHPGAHDLHLLKRHINNNTILGSSKQSQPFLNWRTFGNLHCKVLSLKIKIIILNMRCAKQVHWGPQWSHKEDETTFVNSCLRRIMEYSGLQSVVETYMPNVSGAWYQTEALIS